MITKQIKLFFAAIATLLLLSAELAAANTACDTVSPLSFVYVQRAETPLMLDIYRPSMPRADSACVVYLFGGGFVSGSRTGEDVRRYCQQLAARGFTAVAIDYRLHLKEINGDTIGLRNMQSVFSDAINIAAEDCAAAVAFLCGRASEFGIAANRMVLCGGSAGAIGVMQLDYCRANGLTPAAELPRGWRPAAVVSYAGGVYAEHGKPRYSTPPAPTFFLHGTKDKIVNYKKFPPVLRSGLYGAARLQKCFERNGYPHWFFRYEGIGHEVASLHNYTIAEFMAFVDATLAGRCMFYDATVRDSRVVPTKWTEMNVFDLYRGN